MEHKFESYHRRVKKYFFISRRDQKVLHKWDNTFGDRIAPLLGSTAHI